MQKPGTNRLRLCAIDGCLVNEVFDVSRDGKSLTTATRKKSRRCAAIENKQMAKQHFHKWSQQQARIEGAISLIDTSVDPAEAAIHIKNATRIERSLETALDWLRRFATELEAREQFGNR